MKLRSRNKKLQVHGLDGRNGLYAQWHGANAGFTLIEVLAALAILGLSLFILLETHYSALGLHAAMDEEVTFRQFLEGTVSRAELEIRTGNLAGGGDFGTRHPGWGWSFEALPSGSDDTVLLYEVNCTVTGPTEDRSLKFFVYDTGVTSLLDTGTTIGSGGAGLTATPPSRRTTGGLQ